MANYPIPLGRLEEAFTEKNTILSASEAVREASRCLYCYDAPCIKSCPTAIDIPTFIRKIRTDNVRGSARTILTANLLGDSCARACPVEVLCQSTCVFEGWGQPAIQIGRLQRYAMHHGLADERSGPLLQKAPPTGHSIGLVGTGPASLACAGTLALLGHSPVIYERDAWPGGLNATGIAPYKLKLGDVLSEVAFIESLGVEIRTGIEVGKDVSAETLLTEHRAVFLGLGLGDDGTLDVPGAQGPGVVGATHWIRRLKTDPTLETKGIDHAIVVGGGNTAIDVAHELLGLGIGSVTMVYRRDRAAMSGYEHELAAVLELGLRLETNAAIANIRRNAKAGHRVEAVDLIECVDGKPIDSGHDLGLGSLRAEIVVIAIGQAKLTSVIDQFDGVACDDRGRIIADPITMATGNPRVFTGGDAMNGGKEVVNAVHDGQVAAHSIDQLIAGKDHA